MKCSSTPVLYSTDEMARSLIHVVGILVILMPSLHTGKAEPYFEEEKRLEKLSLILRKRRGLVKVLSTCILSSTSKWPLYLWHLILFSPSIAALRL